MELRQGKQNMKSWEDPTNLVQSVSMGFLCVQRTFNMYRLLLGDLGYVPRKILKIRNNEIEFGSSFDRNVTLVCQDKFTM